MFFFSVGFLNFLCALRLSAPLRETEYPAEGFVITGVSF